MNDEFSDSILSLTSLVEIKGSNKGKNANATITKDGILFDSLEEEHVYEWILEARKLGFISEITYQPESFVLYDGMKNKKGKFIVRPHIYTADYKLKMTDKWKSFVNHNKIKILNDFYDKDNYLYIDVKGQFNKFSGDREFSINHKFMLAIHNIYVWKIIPKKLFEKTWLPKNCVFTLKTKKISKKYSDYKIFENHHFIDS